ncbi:MAG TPA: RNA polymerase subunit sigma-24 [Dysgonomonas sp.]|nr:RNA polymerase subunit sigma-24 [Dysgonomonas sp.]
MESLKVMTDEELVVSYSLGNNLAFDELLHRYQREVYNYIYFVIRNRILTEDIFQETFVKAIMTIKQGRYTENGKFRGWIMRIAHNLMIDHFRREKNENTVSNDEMEMDLLNNASLCDATIEQQLIYDQILRDVKRLVKYLPDSQREVIEMRYYQGMSFKEISEKEGISINTALGRMRYAILNIRKMVEENSIELSV